MILVKFHISIWHGAREKWNWITLTFGALSILFLYWNFFLMVRATSGDTCDPPSMNTLGLKKFSGWKNNQNRKKKDHRMEEKMSHGVRNGTFKATLTLKKIRYMSAKERVLTPSLWWYLTFFWWRYKSILRVSNRGKVEISLLHPKMWFLWENRNFFFFWTLYSQGTLLFKIA